ncbi:odorant receptor 131-2-like [Scleropages formosus]|uniref:odorant receptor 131-2-like n=1 Tax=Scleropages formosus TaxID=113540 RepID=UPI00087836D8|nr:odorant receptor 131-2-like [Scleropages formosus]
MNFSVQSNVSSVVARDNFQTALTKNVIVVALYISINYINGTMVVTFLRHEIFSETPRYILFIHMVLNDMIQLTITVALHVISYTLFTINTSLCCFLLIAAIFSAFNNPLNLAGMAIECYVAVCHPLRHSQICTARRTYMLIGLTLVLGAIPIMSDLFIVLATEPPQFFRSSVFCIRENVFRHPHLQQKKEVSYVLYLTFVWLILVYAYLRILFAAKAVKSDAKKAQNTIMLHAVQLLMSMLTYWGHFMYTFLMYAFPMYILEVRFFHYVTIYILPRLLSPIIYGFRDQAFCKYLMKYLLCKRNEVGHHRTLTLHITIGAQKIQPSL